MYQEKERRFKFIAGGREYHNGAGIGTRAEACDVARKAAANPKTAGVVYTVLELGKLFAAYKLVDGKIEVRMP